VSGPVRITVDRTRLVYWDGAPFARWPSGRRREADGSARWSFAGLVRTIRHYAGSGRSFELTPSAPAQDPGGATPPRGPRPEGREETKT
jgi:hypothetical protein